MRGLRGIESGPQGRRELCPFGDVVGPADERITLVDTTIGDRRQRGQQLRDGWTGQAGVSANSRPMRSNWPVAPPSANSVCLAARK